MPTGSETQVLSPAGDLDWMMYRAAGGWEGDMGTLLNRHLSSVRFLSNTHNATPFHRQGSRGSKKLRTIHCFASRLGSGRRLCMHTHVCVYFPPSPVITLPLPASVWKYHRCLCQLGTHLWLNSIGYPVLTAPRVGMAR